MYSKLIPILALTSLAVPCIAAPVTWGTAFEIASEADIKLSDGPVIYAMTGGANIGTGGSAVGTAARTATTFTFGSKAVEFDGAAVQYGNGNSTYNATTYGNVTDHTAGSGANVTFGVTNPLAGGATVPLANWDPARDGNARTIYNLPTGNSGLDTLLESQIWVDGRSLNTSATPSALNISLNNLTAGQSYQVQLIAGADTRNTAGRTRYNQFIVDDGQGNSVTGFNAYSDLNTDGVSHVTSVVGTFTAGASGTQAVNVGIVFGRQAGISGLIVTAVPEPASLGLIGLAGAVMLRRRRSL